MSAQVPETVDVAKGAICFALNEFSRGNNARKRVKKLRVELAKLAPSYKGLAECFGEFLLPFVFKTKATRDNVVAYLNDHWFDPASPGAYFPGIMVAQIYGTGVLKALDLSLGKTGAPVPFDSWWFLNCDQVELHSLVEQQGGTTVSTVVSLMICTPRPPVMGVTPSGPSILGKTSQAYTTRQVGRKIVTLKVRNERGKDRRG